MFFLIVQHLGGRSNGWIDIKSRRVVHGSSNVKNFLLKKYNLVKCYINNYIFLTSLLNMRASWLSWHSFFIRVLIASNSIELCKAVTLYNKRVLYVICAQVFNWKYLSLLTTIITVWLGSCTCMWLT